MSGFKSVRMPAPEEALPGRMVPIIPAERHFINGRRLDGPVAAGFEQALFGLGCFWGAERRFWQLGEGVHVTAVGYAGGLTPHPTYQEVCSGRTGHNEVVRVVFDPKVIGYDRLVACFFESHDPTQGMRQGNDIGTQYRSAIYVYSPAQQETAVAMRDGFARQLAKGGFGPITTEILPAPEFYFAEDHHQQYLAKNPGGYCGLGGTGFTCPALPVPPTGS